MKVHIYNFITIHIYILRFTFASHKIGKSCIYYRQKSRLDIFLHFTYIFSRPSFLVKIIHDATDDDDNYVPKNLFLFCYLIYCASSYVLIFNTNGLHCSHYCTNFIFTHVCIQSCGCSVHFCVS